jgi:hypothetical protein
VFVLFSAFGPAASTVPPLLSLRGLSVGIRFHGAVFETSMHTTQT